MLLLSVCFSLTSRIDPMENQRNNYIYEATLYGKLQRENRMSCLAPEGLVVPAKE